MSKNVNILGDGLAACCAAHLLLRRGFSVSVRKVGRPKAGKLLISEQTQTLLREIFRAPRLFDRAPQIRRRIVRWGREAETVELPHRGLIVSEQDLLDTLWQQTVVDDAASASIASPQTAWTIVSAANFAALPTPQSLGARHASTAVVELDRKAAEDCCWVESLRDGWLFLLPAGEGRATLISVGYVPESLLEQSILVVRQVSDIVQKTGPAPTFPAFPQILTAVCGPGWLVCGSAAMAFDPLCGEGAGHAAREALLASAIIHAASKGEATKNLLAHYSTRLMQGFSRHLQVCLPFYRSGGSGHFWETETAALERGIAWMQNRLRYRAPFIYRFAGYELESIADGGAAP